MNELGSLGFVCVTDFVLELDDDLCDFETPTPTPTPTAINPTNAIKEPTTCKVELKVSEQFLVGFYATRYPQSILSVSWRPPVSPTSDDPETHHTHRNLVRKAP